MGCLYTSGVTFSRLLLRPAVALRGELLQMDALVSYESSCSNSDGKRVTEDEPLAKKPAIGRTPDLVTVEDDRCTSDEGDPLIRVGFDDTPQTPNADPEGSDSSVQTDNHMDPTFGSEGFHPADSD